MTTTVFPVGHGAGPLASAEYMVRIGRTAEQLTESEFGVWVLAHRWPNLPELMSECTDADIEDAERHVHGLLDRGVLVPADDAMALAQRYRLLPLFIGLGNRRGDPDRFAIGVPGLDPLAVVNATVYELWQWGWVAPSLWAHCEVLATIGEQDEGESGAPNTQLDIVLDGVSTLLSEFVAVLEPVS